METHESLVTSPPLFPPFPPSNQKSMHHHKMHGTLGCSFTFWFGALLFSLMVSSLQGRNNRLIFMDTALFVAPFSAFLINKCARCFHFLIWGIVFLLQLFFCTCSCVWNLLVWWPEWMANVGMVGSNVRTSAIHLHQWYDSVHGEVSESDNGTHLQMWTLIFLATHRRWLDVTSRPGKVSQCFSSFWATLILQLLYITFFFVFSGACKKRDCSNHCTIFCLWTSNQHRFFFLNCGQCIRFWVFWDKKFFFPLCIFAHSFLDALCHSEKFRNLRSWSNKCPFCPIWRWVSRFRWPTFGFHATQDTDAQKWREAFLKSFHLNDKQTGEQMSGTSLNTKNCWRTPFVSLVGVLGVTSSQGVEIGCFLYFLFWHTAFCRDFFFIRMRKTSWRSWCQPLPQRETDPWVVAQDQTQLSKSVSI